MALSYLSGRRGNWVYVTRSISNDANSVVIMTHGFGGNKDKKLFQNLETELNAKKIGTMRYDMFGHGHSEGGIEKLTLSKVVGSLQRIIKSVREDEDLPDNIGLFGYSFGGSISMVAASQDPKIKALVTASAVSDPLKLWTDMLGEEGLVHCMQQGFVPYRDGEKEYKLDADFLTDLSTYDTLALAESIKCPTLIMHGDSDRQIPIEQSQKLADILGTELQVMGGLGHGYDNSPEEYYEVKDMAIEFLVKTLKQQN